MTKSPWSFFYTRLFMVVILPLILSTLATLLLLAVEAAPPFSKHPQLLTLIAIVPTFYVILRLQRALLRGLFSDAVDAYITKTSDRHIVIKRFGAEILRRFLTEAFTSELIGDAPSLPWMLERLEAGEYPLSLPTYAMLLDAAAEREPKILWAVWHLGLVPIADVFDQTGAIAPSYHHYFSTLKQIYRAIPIPDRKTRLFLFPDAATRLKIEQHPGWLRLRRIMVEDWQMTDYWACDASLFRGLKPSHPGATMDDLVYFASDASHADPWIIGMAQPTKAVGFRHGTKAISDFRHLWKVLLTDPDVEHVRL